MFRSATASQRVAGLLIGRRACLSILAGAVGIVLVATLDLHPSAASPEPADDAPWVVKKEKPVPGTAAEVRPRRADPAEARALRSAPVVAWPGEGTAELSVPRRAGATARAGRLPVWVGPATEAADSSGADAPGADTPGAVRVESLGRHGDRLLLAVTRSDGSARAGQVSLTVSYQGFRHAYGGDWASRLRLVRYPDCVPGDAGCVGVPVATRNDGSGTLTAEAGTGPSATLYAVEATSSGGAGDFKASSLSPTATWSVGGASGDFRWSYPMSVPPSIGGPAPDLSLHYSSGSVDGRTSATNNQPSWVGEGFDFTPGGFIERRYKACASDLKGNNGTRKTGDLCWGTDNATFSIGGKGGELVRDDATGVWRPRNDDGSTVERLTGAPNGDNNGEYWRITSTDGTRYYFGLHRLPGWQSGNPQTRSTWTVPVFGNHSGEPCHKTSFADSWCQQAYRWNLDYVVDSNGNTMSLFYDTESNHYARNLTDTTVSSYIRAGNVARIEYGQRAGEVYTTAPVARAVFITAQRCIPGSACTTSEPSTYPDTPLDLACTSSTKCENKYNPTFWTQKRLAKVTTQVRRPTGFATVSTWTLRHSFPDPGDGTRAGLWLEAVTHAGHVGGAMATPEVNFDGIQMENRVDGIDGIPPMNWWRISAVHYGSGGELAVRYSPEQCTATTLPPADDNTKRCHPRKWTPEDQAERTDWFHKYVVVEVTESDRVSGLEPVVTRIDYLSAPAWRFDDADGLVPVKEKTWGQWRGYERVRISRGHPSGVQSVTENRFFRGMDGDRTASGGTKSVSIVDSTGGSVRDADPLAGQLRERLTYSGDTLTNRTITDHWLSAPTATRVRSWGTAKTYHTEDASTRQAEAVSGGWRYTSARNTYSAGGALLASADLRDVSTPDDDTCIRYEYAGNAARRIAEVPVRSFTVDLACDQPWSNADVVADERIYYDGNTSHTAAPTRGNATRGERLAGFTETGAPIYQTVFTATYDAYGRGLRMTDAHGNATTLAYTPATGGPVTKTVLTKPEGHVTTTELEPAWGEEIAVTDPAGRRTEAAYDPLGRTSKVWLPGRDPADAANFEYAYLIRADGANVVSTKTLQADGSFETSYELFDGLLRLRQTQEPAPGGGRVVKDWVYDSRNLQVKENGPYYNDAPPGTDVLLVNEEALPTQKLTTYDALGQPTAEIFRSLGAEKWRISHSNTGDRHTLNPPDGEQPTTRVTDPEGRLVELRQYHGDAPSGSYDRTSYTYTPFGELESVTDPAGNVWRFSYDLRGRKVREEDPDKGVTVNTYDDLDRMVSTTDSRGVTLAYGYDDLGRRTAVHSGSLAGPKLAEWTYDTLAKGELTSATRYVKGHAYTTAVTGYDPAGRPSGTQVRIPEVEGALAGTYTFGKTYNPDGEVASATLPGVADLAAETLTYGYNGQDLPTTLNGAMSYVKFTQYTPFGEPSIVTMYPAGGMWVEHKYEYELGTRRLARVVTDRQTSPRRVANVTYEYDPGGNVTKITDKPSSLSGEPTDTQCFSYDHLRRLTSAWTPANGDCAAAPTASGLGGPAPYWHQWTFDVSGNRKTEKRTSPTGAATTSTYEYPAAGQPQPHALRKVTTTGPAGTTVDQYGYDAEGNLTTRDTGGAAETFSWDAEGHLETVTRDGKTTSFVYDADGNRLLRRDTSGTTLYLEDTEVLLKPDGTLVGTRYYDHGGQVVAVRTGGRVFWLGMDHHGTAHLAIDAQTQQVQRQRSGPYGEVRGEAPASWPGQRGFVGGVNDPSTNLVHLGAREYDPSTGRFISADPVADFEDPQQLNGYAYANNNPVSFADPDGRLAFIPVAIFVVRMVPVVVRVVRHVPTIVRTVTPVVVRTTHVVKSFFSWLFKTITRFVTKLVTTFKTVIKRVVETTRKVVKKVKKIIKKVPVKRVAKKPASRAKQKVKRHIRNAPKVKKAPRVKKRPKAVKKFKKHSERLQKRRGKAKRASESRSRARPRFDHIRDRDWVNPYRGTGRYDRLPDRPDPATLRREIGGPVSEPASLNHGSPEDYGSGGRLGKVGRLALIGGVTASVIKRFADAFAPDN